MFSYVTHGMQMSVLLRLQNVVVVVVGNGSDHNPPSAGILHELVNSTGLYKATFGWGLVGARHAVREAWWDLVEGMYDGVVVVGKVARTRTAQGNAVEFEADDPEENGIPAHRDIHRSLRSQSPL